MPIGWTHTPSDIIAAVKRAGARFGIQSGIMLAGAAIAIGSANRPTPTHQTPLAQQVAQRPVAPAPKIEVASAHAPKPKAKTPKLDRGTKNHRIDAWVEKFSESESFGRSLDRMSEYSDMIFAKLDERNMPRDLIYLAMIESNFNPTARSPVHAVGMWQFMSATARHFGLTVKGKVDERKDPERSTDAALTYLSSLHNRFGSWYLAAAAYNTGEGRVSRTLKRVTGKTKGTDADFFRIAPKLPRETREYVPKLIAAARVGNNPEKYGVPTSSGDEAD